MPYYYNISALGSPSVSVMSFDNFRQIVYGEIYEQETMEEERRRDMGNFLKYLGNLDGYIENAHFIGEDLNGDKISFHLGLNGTYLRDEALYESLIDYDHLNRADNQLILIPTHSNSYMNGLDNPVFTAARNYFDLRGSVGNAPYVGTLFLDINLRSVENLFRKVNFLEKEQLYVVNEKGDCFYSNIPGLTGTNVEKKLEDIKNTEEQLVIRTKSKEYDLTVIVVMDTNQAFESIRKTQCMLYLIIGASVSALLLGSVFFSKRLTKPIHDMMSQMEQIETGNFDIILPVHSGDEIGVLASRFNQMSAALKNYIDKSYMSQIRQNEAELTALKSQIYPHFLYNTLEIIRMTALEDGEGKVPEMIEALSEQIHYLIGPMQDLVPLHKEIDIVQKYIYLLNCRIAGKVQMTVNASGMTKVPIPKLILQPIVENAYVHGIKPQKRKGNIMIEIAARGDNLEISVMDNGVGMEKKQLDRLYALLQGDEPGIKNEYNWQSIGLKNVHDRIRFLYGEDYGIEITSTPGVGTIVKVVMPLQSEEER